MFLKILFPHGKFQKIVEIVTSQTQYTPEYLGENEDKHKKDVPLADKTAVEAFYKANPLGFFMHAERCCYDFSLNSNRPNYLKVYLDEDIVDVNWAVSLFSQLQNIKPAYGFCCCFEEQKHRNKVICPMANGRYEGWVGRDINKYIPGLYALTYLSTEQIAEKQLDLTLLRKNAESCYQYEDGSVLFTFFSDLANWQQYAPKLDNLCEAVEGIFSNREVTRQASEFNDFLRLSELFSKWR